jgi:ABC-2 type transport system ATP-binding protein
MPTMTSESNPDSNASRGVANSRRILESVISLSSLTKTYEPTPKWMRAFARTHIREPVRALDRIDLSVAAGEICAIVGPNGAGKTTMFKILVGLTTPTSGSGLVFGFDIATQSEQIRQVVGWMPSEDRSLLMRATVRENLLLHGRLQGMTKHDLAERIPRVLEMVNLIAQINSVVASLSAGMKARLRLARALLPEPRALILDEPTGAVDPVAAHGLLNLITNLVEREQLAVLISSHRLEEIEALKSKALLMSEGRVKYSGDLDTLRDRWEKPRLELIFSDTSSALSGSQALLREGFDAVAVDTTVRCSLPRVGGVGAVVSALGKEALSIQHIREQPMPLRDLIALVYQTEPPLRENTP